MPFGFLNIANEDEYQVMKVVIQHYGTICQGSPYKNRKLLLETEFSFT